MAQKRKDKNKIRLWVVYSEEEQPVAVVWAKTSPKAREMVEAQSGINHHVLHAEEMNFSQRCYLFPFEYQGI